MKEIEFIQPLPYRLIETIKQKKQQAVAQCSPYLQEYLQVMQQMHIQKQSLQKKNSSIKEKIQRQTADNSFDQLNIKIVSQSINKEAITLRAEWRLFQANVNILNIRGQNSKHGVAMKNGGFGTIYKCLYQGKEIIIKCVPLSQQIARYQVIKEWLLLKIASIAQFGPKLLSCFGFDIFMYETCVEFAMEKCLPISSDNMSEAQLYENISLMHNLHFVHADIKPENIMFSPFHNKLVFIDFGLSMIVKEEIGQKSWTAFRGSLKYCIKEMKACFVEDKKMQVDLYYNDLCCLSKSIDALQSLIEKQFDQIKNSEPQIYYKNDELNSFQHFQVYFLKFNLYTLQIQLFEQFWDKQLKKDTKKNIITEILQFLLELSPCQSLKQVFLKIMDDSLVQTEIYSKIKLIYETSQQRLCSIELLRDSEKERIFEEYYSQYQTDHTLITLSPSLNSRKLTLSELIMSPKDIKQVSFQKYAGFYLEYMSYINNKYKVTWVEREKAAIVFYELFIFSPVPFELKGRLIVEKTIKYILQWMIHTSDFEGDSDTFSILVFRMFDFLVILCSQQSQQFIRLISSVYRHPCLTESHRALFWLRIKQSGFFLISHLFTGWKESRLSMLSNLLLWLEEERQKGSLKELIALILEEYNSQNLQRLRLISSDFMEEFGVETIQSQLINRRYTIFQVASVRCGYIELFNRLHARAKHLKIYYTTLAFYDYFLERENSEAVCKRVVAIIENNFADPYLMQEYVFSMELDLLFPILHCQDEKIKPQILVKLNQQMLKIKEENMILLSHLLSTSMVKIYRMFVNEGMIKKGESNFMDKFLEGLKDHFSSFLFHDNKQKDAHHLSVYDFYQLGVWARLVKQKNYYFSKQFFQEQNLRDIKCPDCRCAAQQYNKFVALQQYVNTYNSSRKNKNSWDVQDQQGILDSYLIESRKFETELLISESSAKKNFQMLSFIFALKQHLCKESSFLERKCHGLEEFYDFCLKYDCFQQYFKPHYLQSDAIFSTMLMLLCKRYDELFVFLLKLIQVIAEDQSQKTYHTIVFYFSYFLKYNQAIHLQLFLDLLIAHKNSLNQSQYVVILYAVFFKSACSCQLQNKIAVAIFQFAYRLPVCFQRKIMIDLFEKRLKSIELHKRQKNNRFFIFINNRLLKLLMIEGRTKFISNGSNAFKTKRSALRNKISKIGKFSSNTLRLTFQTNLATK